MTDLSPARADVAASAVRYFDEPDGFFAPAPLVATAPAHNPDPEVLLPDPPPALPPLYVLAPPGAVINQQAHRECAGNVAGYYHKHQQWTLIPIPWGDKGPKTPGWQRLQGNAVPAGWRGNVGLNHAASGTCALDIDDARRCVGLFSALGLDYQGLMEGKDAVQIRSGKANSAKLLYGLVFPMPSLKVYVDGQPVVDFRCATQKGEPGVQDVLPPSMHPAGRCYEWCGAGDWRCLPALPGDVLAVWTRLREMARGGGDLHLDGAYQVVGKDGRKKDGTRAARQSATTGQAGPGEWRWDQETPDDRRHKAVEALGYLDPDMTRPEWVEVGMSFHACGGEFDEFDAWSAKGTKYAGANDTAAVWRSFDASGGVGPGTLFGRAAAAGWKGNTRPKPPVEEMFDPAAIAAAEAAVGVGAVGPAAVSAAPVILAEPMVDVAQLKADLAAVDRDTASGAVGILVRRMALASLQQADGWNELDKQRAFKQLARSAGVPVKTIREGYQMFDADLRKSGGFKTPVPSSTDRRDPLQRAMSLLREPAIPDPKTLLDMASRYIWLPEQAAFYDRLTARWITTKGFNGRYAHLRNALGGTEEDRTVTPSDLLLESALSVKPDVVDYWPGKDPVYLQNGVLALNGWVDDGEKGAPGDVRRWLKHLAWLIPSEQEQKHLLQWMAFCLRHQDQKINHNILFGGLERTGKDALFQPFIRALGDSNVKNISPSRLNEPYEDDFAFKKLTILNELHDSDMSHTKLENKLKKFGAAPPNRITLRMFGEKHVTINNVVQLIAFTNHKDATVFRTSKERWACYWCAPTRARSPIYYKRFYEWLNSGGVGAVIHYLMTEVDISDFNHGGTAPETEWQDVMAAVGSHADPLVEVIQHHIQHKNPGWEKDIIKLRDVVTALQSEMQLVDKDVKVNMRTVARAMAMAGCLYSGTRFIKNKKIKNNQKILAWAVRDLEKWKKENGASWWAHYSPEPGSVPTTQDAGD